MSRVRTLAAISHLLSAVLLAAVGSHSCLAECRELAAHVLPRKVTEIEKSSVYVHFHSRGAGKGLLSVYSNYIPADLVGEQVATKDFRDLENIGALGIRGVVNEVLTSTYGRSAINAQTDLSGITCHFGHDFFDEDGQPRTNALTADVKSYIVYGDEKSIKSYELESMLSPVEPKIKYPFAAKLGKGLYFRVAGPTHLPMQIIDKLSKSPMPKAISVGYTALGGAFKNEIEKSIPSAVSISSSKNLDAVVPDNGMAVIFGHLHKSGNGLDLYNNTNPLSYTEIEKKAKERHTILITVSCYSAAANVQVGVRTTFNPIDALKSYHAAKQSATIFEFLDKFASANNDVQLILNPESSSFANNAVDQVAIFDVVTTEKIKIASSKAGTIRFVSLNPDRAFAMLPRLGNRYVVGQVRVFVP